MSNTLKSIRKLISEGDVRISQHGYDELAADSLSAREVVSGVHDAVVVEDYPDYHKGSCVLLRQIDKNHIPFHALWGIPKGQTSPAVLITAYRPAPSLWEQGLLRRKK